MVHEAIPGLVNALPNNVKVTTVWETKDHYLKDYTPYVELKVKGRLNPEHLKVIQAQKGMIFLDIRCGLCDCLDSSGTGEEKVEKVGGFVSIALTPIISSYESDQMDDWVEELQRHFDRRKTRKGQSV